MNKHVRLPRQSDDCRQLSGITLPGSAGKMRVGKGDQLCLTETPEGILLTPYSAEFAEIMEAAEIVMRENRDALRALAGRLTPVGSAGYSRNALVNSLNTAEEKACATKACSTRRLAGPRTNWPMANPISSNLRRPMPMASPAIIRRGWQQRTGSLPPSLLYVNGLR